MGDKITNNSICDLSGLNILGKGVDGTVYDLENESVLKKINITKKNIKNLKWEIKIMKKISSDPSFPTLYGIKICSPKKEPYLLIKMEKFYYTLTDWMKKEHSVEEWKKVFKQIFTIIDRLNYKYKISINDVKPDNFMFKNGELKMIDFGLNEYYNGKQLNYANMINLYCDKYAINMYTISEELLKKGWSRDKSWRYATNYKLTKGLFKDGTLDITKIKKWEYPTKIIPFIKELQKGYGKTAKYFLEKYFQDIE